MAMTDKTRQRIAELVATWPPLSDTLKGELSRVLSDDGQSQGCQGRTGCAELSAGTGQTAAA